MARPARHQVGTALRSCPQGGGNMANGLQVRSPAVPVRFSARCSIPCIAAAEQELCPPLFCTLSRLRPQAKKQAPQARRRCGPASLPRSPQPLSNAATPPKKNLVPWCLGGEKIPPPRLRDKQSPPRRQPPKTPFFRVFRVFRGSESPAAQPPLSPPSVPVFPDFQIVKPPSFPPIPTAFFIWNS